MQGMLWENISALSLQASKLSLSPTLVTQQASVFAPINLLQKQVELH